MSGDVRPVALLDSRVTLCSSAKGRSPSHALRPSLRRRAAQLLGRGLYPAYAFAPTRLNVADAPTRDRELPEPWGPPPRWLQGDAPVLDLALGLPPLPAAAAAWARFGLHLLDLAQLAPAPLRSTAGPTPALDFLHREAADPLAYAQLCAWRPLPALTPRCGFQARARGSARTSSPWKGRFPPTPTPREKGRVRLSRAVCWSNAGLPSRRRVRSCLAADIWNGRTATGAAPACSPWSGTGVREAFLRSPSSWPASPAVRST